LFLDTRKVGGETNNPPLTFFNMDNIYEDFVKAFREEEMKSKISKQKSLKRKQKLTRSEKLRKVSRTESVKRMLIDRADRYFSREIKEYSRTDGKLTKRFKEAARKLKAATRQIVSEI